MEQPMDYENHVYREAIKTLIIDGDPLVRRGLASLLAESNKLAVIGEATTVSEAVYYVRAWQPQIAFVTAAFLRDNGTVFITEIQEAADHLKIIVTGGTITKKSMLRAVEAGAFAYVASESPLSDFEYVATEAVESGRPVLPEIASELLHDALAKRRTRSGHDLTQREREVLDHIAQGMSNKEIANALFVSVGTVKAHVSNILRKMGAADRTQAMIQAIKEGMVERFEGI